MKPNQFSAKEISDKFIAGMATAETGRIDGLKKLQVLQSVKDKAQIREHRRLQTKLGPQHPRVQDLEARIRNNQGVVKDLAVHIEKSTIEAPKIDEQKWMVHGRVMDIKRQGRSDLTVGIFDAEDHWVREAGHSCTDDRGYFAIVYAPAQDTADETKQQDKYFLHVIGPGDRLLHKDSNPLRLAAGRLEYREYFLDPDDTIRKTPQGGRWQTDVPSCDPWMLQGKISDTTGKPLPDLEIGVFYIEGKAKKKLGSAKSAINGRYEVTRSPKDAEKGPDPGANLIITVTDASGKIVYESDKDVHYKLGQTVVFNIQIRFPG